MPPHFQSSDPNWKRIQSGYHNRSPLRRTVLRRWKYFSEIFLRHARSLVVSLVVLLPRRSCSGFRLNTNGPCEEDDVTALPFPQDKLLAVKYAQSTGETKTYYDDNAFFLPSSKGGGTPLVVTMVNPSNFSLVDITPPPPTTANSSEKEKQKAKNMRQFGWWDTVGQENFKAISSSYYHGTHGVIKFESFSLTSQGTGGKLRSLKCMEGVIRQVGIGRSIAIL
ncbi:hypothetical protein EJ110_NYTH01982 [Nymphaea thermarum]|nr:hypothetical protein EJ110_NYTH01982 [Nymphaea thermarum]